MGNKIKYILAVLAICYLGASEAQAETVTRKEASKIAETFFNAAYGEYVAAPKMVWNGRQLTTDRLFSPFYIFNHSKGGFVIIAADSKAYPILGYSKTQNFDRSRLTDEETELLKRYAHEIEMIRYDDRQPEKAMAAWRNIPLAIHKALNNPYDTAEFAQLTEESKERLEAIDRRNAGIMMPTAVEFQIYRPEDFRDYTLDDVLGEEEYVPFSFYKDFIKEIQEEERTRAASLEEIISPTKPVVDHLGGAHFALRFPTDMRMVVVYSMQGQRMIERYYRGSSVINLDLSTLPAGFYAVLALADDGRIYGLKLYR